MTASALHRRWESPLLFFAALLWVPGAGGNAFLSDDIGHLSAWGLPPFDQVWQWFYKQDFSYYRPLTALLWKVEFSLWGLNPLGYQLVNFALHTGCALLVRQLGLLLFPGANRAGFLAALVFLFLPGHIFGVLMVSALTGLLCSLFYLAAAVCYLRGRAGSRPALFLGPLFFTLALGTKELALALPLLIGTWEIIALRTEQRLTATRWLKACLPYGAVAALYLVLRWILFAQMPHSPLHAHPTATRLLVNITTYAAKSVAPWGLEGLKPLFRANRPALVLVAAGAMVLAAGLAWRDRRSIETGHVFGFFWFGIATLPVASLYSPWNTYLPSVGTALILGAFADWTRSITRKRERQVAAGLFLALCIIYSLNHQQHWLEARDLCARLAATVEQESGGTVYLANLPAEWNEAPLYVGDWALRGALHLQGNNRQVVALANVIKNRAEDRLETILLDDSTFALRLTTPGEFFRLESTEILSGARRPTRGYAYNKSGADISVAGLDTQGEANALHITMGSPEDMALVRVWDGKRLIPLVAP